MTEIKSNQPPIKKGQRLKVTIDSLGRRNDGVARINGFAIIIPNTKMNNKYNIIITSVHQKFAFGVIDESKTHTKNDEFAELDEIDLKDNKGDIYG